LGVPGQQGSTGAQGPAGQTGSTGAPGPGTSITTTGLTGGAGATSTTYYPILVNSVNPQQAVIANSTYPLSYAPDTGTLNAQVVNAASDVKIKQEIKALTFDYAATLLSRTNPVEYKFMNDPLKKRFGLIAQEVEEMFKGENLGLHYKQLGENGKEQQYLSYLELIAPLIKVVNELVERVKFLESKL
jgi:hypothetical protein